MSVKGWNFKLLIVVGHGSKGGRRVRLPSSAPLKTLGIPTIPRVFNLVKIPAWTHGDHNRRKRTPPI